MLRTKMRVGLVLLILCAIGVGVARATTIGAVARIGKSEQQSTPPGLLVSARGGHLLEARQVSSVTSVSPPFDSVQFARVNASRNVVCATVRAPSVEDNGLSRTWVFAAVRPAGGPCGGPAGDKGYFAIGFKDQTRTVSPQLP